VKLTKRIIGENFFIKTCSSLHKRTKADRIIFSWWKFKRNGRVAFFKLFYFKKRLKELSLSLQKNKKKTKKELKKF